MGVTGQGLCQATERLGLVLPQGGAQTESSAQRASGVVSVDTGVCYVQTPCPASSLRLMVRQG